MSAGEAGGAHGPDPTIEGHSVRVALLEFARPALAASARKHVALGHSLDTIGFYVIDVADALAMRLALVIWTRFGGVPPLVPPPRRLGAARVIALAALAASAGPAYAETAEALRQQLPPQHMHVLVVAAGDIVTDTFEYRLQQPAVA